VVNTAGGSNRFAFNVHSTFATLIHVRHVILFAEDLVPQGVVSASYHFLAHRAVLLGLLEVAFADRLVLEEVVRVPQGFVAHVALHAFWMIIGSVVLDTVPDYLLLTHTALFLTSLEALGAESLLVFCMELAVKLLSATVATETLLVKDLSKCGATLFSEIPLTMVALL